MKVLVLGTGKMGYGLLKDLVAQREVEEVVAADANATKRPSALMLGVKL